MENNFIQMASLAGHTVAYTIDSIFTHIIDCVQPSWPNDIRNAADNAKVTHFGCFGFSMYACMDMFEVVRNQIGDESFGYS